MDLYTNIESDPAARVPSGELDSLPDPPASEPPVSAVLDYAFRTMMPAVFAAQKNADAAI